MSFVSVIAKSKFISIMSDGREYIKAGSKFITINESYQKFRILSEQNFIAFTGTKELAEKIIRDFGIENKKSINWKKFGSDLISILKQDLYKSNNLQFTFGGKLLNSRLGFYTTGSTNHTLTLNECITETDIIYSLHTSSNFQKHLDINNMFIDCYKRANGLSEIEKIKNTQHSLNKMVSEVDDTVNNNIFYFLIQ